MSATQKILLIGAGGRMGRAFLDAASRRPETAVTVAVVKPGDDAAKRALAAASPEGPESLRIVEDGVPHIETVDLVVEFAEPAATERYARAAAAAKRPFLSGTTGLGESARAALEEAASRVAVFHAPNLSLGVAVLAHLVREAARRLGPGYDVEIVEKHHRAKVDAPSGTALRLLMAVQEARGRGPVVHGREGRTGPRREGEIGVHAVRAGDIVGEHAVLFAGPGESLELSHAAASRACFAEGALRAAAFLRSARPGLYGMEDLPAGGRG